MNFAFLTANPFSPEDVINKLLPNGIWPLITQLLTTIVLFVIVQKLVYKPVKAMLEKRATYIKKNIDDSARDQKLAETKLQDADKRLAKAKVEAQRILAIAQEETSIAKGEALDDLRLQTQRLRLQAEADIEAASEQAKDDIRKEMVSVALEASKRVLERELLTADNDKIVDDFIKGRTH